MRREILEAQTAWMIGHREPACVDLVASILPKLKQVFMTEQRVFLLASSGTGLLEAGIRNCVGRRVLSCVNGAFSQRWREIAAANGKAHDVLEVAWGAAIKPEMVSQRLASGAYDAICITHNETSTGVVNPVKALVEAVRQAPNGDEIVIMVDSVSGLSGAELPFDEWDLDLVVTSSQKAFALPPGLAFAAVSERAMARAAAVPFRGYYFDFLDLDKYHQKNQTPATPAISLLYALDRQLDDILAEGMPARLARHLAMRDRTVAWAESHGLTVFAEAGYRSPTVSCIGNDKGWDISALNKYLRERGMVISNGYGSQLKGKTFRIGHMGDHQMADLEALLAAVDGYIA